MKKLMMLTLLVVFTAFIFAANIRIVTEEYPPFNYQKGGVLLGLSTDVVNAVLKELKMEDQKIEVLPWARTYNIALNTPNVMIYSITRTKKRENLFNWVGVVASEPNAFFIRKGSNVNPGSIADLKKLKIATVRDDQSEQLLVGAGLGGRLDKGKDIKASINKLLNGRVDLMYYGNVVGMYIARTMGKDSEIETVPLKITNEAGVMYMAFSKSTPAATVDKFKKAYEKVVASGEFQKIQDRWSK